MAKAVQVERSLASISSSSVVHDAKIADHPSKEELVEDAKILNNQFGNRIDKLLQSVFK